MTTSGLLAMSPAEKKERALRRTILYSYCVTLGLTALVLAVAPCRAIAQDKCLPVTDDVKKRLSQYVQKKAKLPPTLALNVVEVSPIADTCYRKLRFEGVGPKPIEFELFLSPDRRFLTRDLSDSQLDPGIEEEKKAEQLRVGLTKANAPSIGPTNAPVSLVVFSDFQCPFCRNAATILRQVASSEGKNVRITFRHLPLRMHTWAHAAAEASACAQMQSGETFWKLHDLIFENQGGFTVDNVSGRILEYARTIPELDVPKFQACLANRTSSLMVSEDIKFASANDIAATPTFFVDGRRVQGIRTADQLITVIRGRLAPPVKTARQ